MHYCLTVSVKTKRRWLEAKHASGLTADRFLINLIEMMMMKLNENELKDIIGAGSSAGNFSENDVKAILLRYSFHIARTLTNAQLKIGDLPNDDEVAGYNRALREAAKLIKG